MTENMTTERVDYPLLSSLGFIVYRNRSGHLFVCSGTTGDEYVNLSTEEELRAWANGWLSGRLSANRN